jgi:hypothetical protein
MGCKDSPVAAAAAAAAISGRPLPPHQEAAEGEEEPSEPLPEWPPQVGRQAGKQEGGDGLIESIGLGWIGLDWIGGEELVV